MNIPLASSLRRTDTPFAAGGLAAYGIFLTALFASVLLPQHLARAAGGMVTIHITGISRPPGFLPDIAAVHVNDVIVFTNDARPAQTYTLAADDGSFFSPPIATGTQWHLTLTKPGTYEYHAVGIALQMVGTILVAPASITFLSTLLQELLPAKSRRFEQQTWPLNLEPSSANKPSSYW